VTHNPAHTNPRARRISVYIDPACPWTWVTAQWLREVAPHRNLGLRWRPLSLWLRGGDQPPADAPAEIQALAVATRIQSDRLLRVFEALRRLPRRRHRPPLPPVGPAGLHTIATARITRAAPDRRDRHRRWASPSWATSADDPSWDPAITAAMNAAAAAFGPQPTSPTIVADDEPAAGLAGPVFTHAPTGPAALRAWDAVSTLLTEPGFVELHRPRTSPVPRLQHPVNLQPPARPRLPADDQLWPGSNLSQSASPSSHCHEDQFSARNPPSGAGQRCPLP
jgi:hypothetical protein